MSSSKGRSLSRTSSTVAVVVVMVALVFCAVAERAEAIDLNKLKVVGHPAALRQIEWSGCGWCAIEAYANIIVRDVPNEPESIAVQCSTISNCYDVSMYMGSCNPQTVVAFVPTDPTLRTRTTTCFRPGDEETSACVRFVGRSVGHSANNPLMGLTQPVGALTVSTECPIP